MSTIIELRKNELTLQINQLIRDVQFFIDNKKRNENAVSIFQYLEYNEGKVQNIHNKLKQIKNRFDPQSDNFASFEDCIKKLKAIQNDIIEIQKRGESKLGSLQFILLFKIIITIALSALYIWIWLIYWDWLEGWRYITLIVTFWYLPCYPFLLVLFLIEEDWWTFLVFRKFFTRLLLTD